MNRVLHRSGTVIAADFRPRPSNAITITLETETLYHDDHVTLVRCTAHMGGQAVATTHVLGDLATGNVTST